MHRRYFCNGPFLEREYPTVVTHRQGLYWESGCLAYSSCSYMGTGMIASSSTFYPHPGEGHGDLSLQQSYKEAVASTSLAIISGGLPVVYPSSSVRQQC